jgi:hypothetical protein
VSPGFNLAFPDSPSVPQYLNAFESRNATCKANKALRLTQTNCGQDVVYLCNNNSAKLDAFTFQPIGPEYKLGLVVTINITDNPAYLVSASLQANSTKSAFGNLSMSMATIPNDSVTGYTLMALNSTDEGIVIYDDVIPSQTSLTSDE